MWWINVMVGAAAGMFAVLVASFIFGSGPKGMKSAGRGHKFAYFVAFALSWSMAKEFIAPQLHRAYAAHTLGDQLTSNPAFAALKKYQREIYEQVLAQGKKDITAGVEMPAVQANVRNHLTPLIEKSVTVADDRAVADYMKVMMAEVGELYAGGDAACYTFLFPQSGPPFDVTKRIKASTREADLAALARVIETASTAPQKKLTIEEVQPQFLPAVLEVQKKHGEDAFELLNGPQTAMQKQRKACEVTMDLYGAVLKADAIPAGRVLRALLASGG